MKQRRRINAVDEAEEKNKGLKREGIHRLMVGVGVQITS
jgi:hypothetical protein